MLISIFLNIEKLLKIQVFDVPGCHKINYFLFLFRSDSQDAFGDKFFMIFCDFVVHLGDSTDDRRQHLYGNGSYAINKNQSRDVEKQRQRWPAVGELP